MTIQEAKNVMIEKIKELSGVEGDITEDTLLVKDMGMSSIQLLAMLGELSDIFDIELKPSKLKKVKTVGELLDYMIKQL